MCLRDPNSRKKERCRQGDERIKAWRCPAEKERTDKASVMIIAVCQLPRRRKSRMRLLGPEKRTQKLSFIGDI